MGVVDQLQWFLIVTIGFLIPEDVALATGVMFLGDYKSADDDDDADDLSVEVLRNHSY